MNTAEIRAALAAATPGPWAWLYPDQCCRDGYCIKSKADLDTCDGVTHAMKALHADVVLIANTPTWLAELLAEVDRLTRWKTEMMITVLHGLQDLGKVLGLPLGEQITGETAAEAAHALRARAEAAEQAVQRVREFAEQGREFADRTMDDAAAHWARSAADGIIRALDGR